MTTKYYDVDGVPGEWEQGKMPKIFRRGEWVTYYQLDRFQSNACEIPKEAFDHMVEAEQATGEG